MRWAVREKTERLIDPSCGDGRFLAAHQNSVGIEFDPAAAGDAVARAPGSLVHEGDFFTWAANTVERFDGGGGNPPFIRYQIFKGQIRDNALSFCKRLGVNFSKQTSSWAPFLVATASVLKPGGRLAFVVPAELGHAPYSAPVLEFLVQHFSTVHIIAFRQKIFPTLSEDCWLLFSDGYGGSTESIRFSAMDQFCFMPTLPTDYVSISVSEWRSVWNSRIRPFFMPTAAREMYRHIVMDRKAARLSDFATVGIGYVTGDNDFFHLRPSTAHKLDIPSKFLLPSVRNGRVLPSGPLTRETINKWSDNDDEFLLLYIPKNEDFPTSVRRYLDSDAGLTARLAFKCRSRDPWYSVPDVRFPSLFLSYMSGTQPQLVENVANCTCTNSVHAVRLKGTISANSLLNLWGHDFTKLSCEIEGHPLGGGMLKIEPKEASRIVLASPSILREVETTVLTDALKTMRAWRHNVT